MARSNYSTTIAIDTVRSTFHFYSMIGNDKSTLKHTVKNYTGAQFDDEFFKKFKEAVKEFAADNPSESIRKVSVIIPDSAVITDAVKLPTLRGMSQTKKALDVTMRGIYRNYNDLRVLSYPASQNRQYSIFAVSAVQKHIITSIYAACSENKLLVDTLTFASNAAVCGATMINPKLKNASYLFLDIKDIYARFAFVVNGKTVAYYMLPFGLEFLRKPKVTQEDMLFDHMYAELILLNAREKAKAKKLTMMPLGDDEDETTEKPEDENADGENAEKPEDENADGENAEKPEGENADGESAEKPEGENDDGAESAGASAPKQRNFLAKTPRKLPKFMQREIPTTPEGIAYENFRVFIKWALTLIQGNEKFTEIGKPEFVCVNLPEDLLGVIEKANEEAEENGLKFTALPIENTEAAIASNLELYSGLFPKQMGAVNKF